MAQNSLPKTVAELLDLATQCKNGLTAHAVALGILQPTAATLGTAFAALQAKQLAFNNKRTAHAVAYDPFHLQVGSLRKICLDARKILSISFGDDWNPKWVDAGWTNSTTEVPEQAAALQQLGTSLVTFLTDNADYQVDTAKIKFTPAAIQTVLTALAPLASAVNAKAQEQSQARANRAVEEKALRSQLRILIKVLGETLDSNDAMWDAFGLNRPGAKVTPKAPLQPALTKVAAGKVLAEVVPVEGATYYRWFAQLVGVDADFRFISRSQDPLFELKDLPATGTLKVKVQAANPAGPGKASPIATTQLA